MKNILSKTLVSIFVGILFILTTGSALAAPTIEVPADATSGKRFILNFSGLDANSCYVVFILDTKTNKNIIPQGGNTGNCDRGGYSLKNERYTAIQTASGTTSAANVEILSAGSYIVVLNKYTDQEVFGNFWNVNVTRIADTTLTIKESGISPTPTPTIPPRPTEAAFNCENRPPSCGKSQYPQCQSAGTEATGIKNCGDAGYSCGFLSGGNHFCAYPATVTPPPPDTNNSCQLINRGDIDNAETEIPRCATGWRGFNKIEGSPLTCTCIPNNAPEPTREATAVTCADPCPNARYPIHDEATGSCKAIDSEESVPVCVDPDALGPTKPPPHPPCDDPELEGTEFVGCKSIFTGLGIRISTNPTEFISDLFGILLSISGTILLLLVIYSGYQFMTSQGDAEKIKAARERIMSAIIGFVFLVFSLVILEAIGVDILKIPGFEKDSPPVNREGINNVNTPKQNQRTRE